MTVTEPKTGDDKPFRVEYARSRGSSCRRCGHPIDQDALRLAVMADSSTVAEARTPQWFHYSCFWMQNKVGSLNDIEGWRDLRPDDQQLLEERIHGAGLISEGLTEEEEMGKMEERPVSEAAYAALEAGAHAAGMRIFKVGYARSRGSLCRTCDSYIPQNSLRIGKRDTDTHHAMKYGPRVQWHHVKCFYENRDSLEFGSDASIEDLPGFKDLRLPDQHRLIDMFGKKGGGQKGGERPRSVTNIEEKQGDEKAQHPSTFKPHMAADFEGGKIRAKPVLAEGAEEGELEEGEEVEGPRITAKEPPQRKKEQENVPMEEEGRYQPPPLLETGERPLTHLRFFMAGRMSRPLHEVRDDMERLGATIVPDVDESVVAAIVSDYKARIGSQSKHVRAAMEANVHVVGEGFVDAVVEAARQGRLIADPASYKEYKTGNEGNKIWLADLVVKHALIENVGSDVAARIRRSLARAQELPGGRHLGKSTSVEAARPPSPTAPPEEKRMRVAPDRFTVDSESELEDEAHVYQENGVPWSILLHSIPEVSVTNFYYRIQLLESNDGKAWWVYRSWGRVGTAIGSNKLDVFESKEDAKRNFEITFAEKTGNMWNNGSFSTERFPGRYYPLEETAETGEAQHISIAEREKMSVD